MKNIVTIIIGCCSILVGVSLVGACLWLYSFCFEYSMYTIFGKDLPWYVDLVGGLITNGVIVTVAFIMWVIELCGVALPLVN